MSHNIKLIDPLELADRDPAYAKMLLEALQQEAKNVMFVKSKDNNNNDNNNSNQNEETNDNKPQ